jgi:hypothetical protein
MNFSNIQIQHLNIRMKQLKYFKHIFATYEIAAQHHLDAWASGSLLECGARWRRQANGGLLVQ